MKKRKVIHIYNRAYDAYFPHKDSDGYYLAGWSSVVARRTVKYTNMFMVENWRPEREIRHPITRKVNGIMCRLFPAKYIKHFGDWSPAMLKELRIQIKENDILIHHSSIHSNSLYLTASLFRNVPIVAQHHGDSPSILRLRQKGKFRILLTLFIEKFFLRYLDYFFVLRKSEMDFLSKFVPNSHITIQTMGVDFDEFKPIDKCSARKKLNLPLDKKIILYIGRLYRLKGVNIILKTFQELKRKYDLELVLVGGSPQHELYEEVKSSEARFCGRKPHNELPLYYNAADIYLLPAFSPNYFGIDVSAIESLACGTPVVSPILNEFPTCNKEKLGKIPRDETDVVRCVSEILDNPVLFQDCREIVKKYYDWKNIIHRTVDVYDMLFEKYYGRK